MPEKERSKRESERNRSLNLLLDLANLEFEYDRELVNMHTKHYKQREQKVKEIFPGLDIAVDVFRAKTDSSPDNPELPEAAVLARARFWKDRTVQTLFLRHWETKEYLKRLQQDTNDN